MDVSEFKSRLILSRTWDVDKDAGGKPLGAKFTLRMPSDQDVQRAFIRHRGEDGNLPDAEVPGLYLEIAIACLINWQGVTGKMIDPGGKFDDEVPFDPEFGRYLLECNVAISNALGESVFLRRNDRDERRKADQKNSERASNTSEV